jgi:hypothetical protein
MSIAKMLPMSVAAALVTLVLSSPTFSQPSMAPTVAQSSVQADSDSSADPDGKICLCVDGHCLCVSF